MFGTYENYAYLRDKQNLTDYTVAKMCNMNRSTISDWKLGKHQPQKKTLQKVADVLGVSVNDFYKDPRQMESEKKLANEILSPTPPIKKIKVQLSNNREIELTEKQYADLKKSLDVFIDSWIAVYGEE